MKFLLLLVCIAMANAKVINKNDCGTIVNGIGHEKTVLKDYVNMPYQLAIDYNANVLYFSYTLPGARTSFALGAFNLKTNSFGTITGVPGSFANAVDEKTHTVYFGGSNGIYKLNPGSNTATNLGVTDKNIWQLFVKDGVYFTTYPAEEAYLYKNGAVSRLAELSDTKAMLVAVDNAQNIFFSNSSGLFSYTKRDGKTNHVGDYTLNGFTSDINGKLFFSTPTGIYAIDENTHRVKMVATIINIFGVAVESDGSFIYASDNKIIRLISTGKECFD